MATNPKAPKHPVELFSGKTSTEFWRRINLIAHKRRRRKIARSTSTALYLMGCRCQELESMVRRLTARVVQLEAQNNSSTQNNAKDTPAV